MGSDLASPAATPTARPHVLAYPSATTARYLIFVAAMVCSGLFVGNWLHGEVRGDEWTRTVIACERPALGDPVSIDQLLRDQKARSECTKGVERTRAAFLFGGATLVVLGSSVLLMLAPRVVEHRRRLRHLGPRLAGAGERFALLADHARVSRRVRPMIGRASQRDAFSYGAPGRNRVALPPAIAVRWRDTQTFDAVVAHELAHVSRRDVSLAWIVRSVWYVLGPLLALPIVAGIFSDDRSIILDYSWRVLVLAAVVILISNSLLRSREYDADLSAARRLDNPEQVEALVRRATAKQRSRLSWVVARHPTPAERIEVITRPERLARTGFADGFVSALLTALALPLLVSSFTTLLATVGRTEGAWLISAALVGPIFGATVGLSAWRASLVARVTRRPADVSRLALGVGVGFAAGETASLAQAGTVSLTGLNQPWWLVVMALAVTGATVVSASLGELWADIAPVMPNARLSWVIAFLVNALLFTTVLWAAVQFETALDVGSWDIARAALGAGLSTWPVVVIVLVLSLAAAVPLTRNLKGRPAPSWLIESGGAPTWPSEGRVHLSTVVGGSLAAGLTAGLVMIAYRVIAGASDEFDELWLRYWAYVWVAAGAAMIVAAVLGLFLGKRGLAAGLVGAPLAALSASACFLTMNTVLGGDLTWAFASEFAKPAVAIGFYLCLVIAPLTLLRPAGTGAALRAPHPVIIVATAVVSSLTLSLATIAAREFLAPPSELEVSAGLDSADVTRTDFTTYIATVVPAIQLRFPPIENALRQIDAGNFPTQELTRLDEDVISPLRILTQDMADVTSATQEVAQVHAEVVSALRTALRCAETLREFYVTGEPTTYAEAVELFRRANQELQGWQAAREALAKQLVDE